MLQHLKALLTRPVSAAPLAVFRLVFGAMMLLSIIRFMGKGWVSELYIMPRVYFPYYGLEWIKPLGAAGMYGVFGLMALSALGIMLGLFYRWSAWLFFISFTYVELIDKTNYLNHYYFVSIVAFLLLWVPAHRHFSLDVRRRPGLWVSHVPAWMVFIFQLQLGLVYFFAGLSKLHYDWLVLAMPLRYWLPAHTHLPLIGPLFDKVWVAYLFCWFGAAYDLTIPFFLAWGRSRVVAYLTVIVFHVFTALLFQIGMFPYIMMVSTLIFFSGRFHQRLLQRLRKSAHTSIPAGPVVAGVAPAFGRVLAGVLVLHFMLQLLLPLRFALYPGKLLWTEQGYRFSWRVMLLEKTGTAFFYVRNPATGQESEIYNRTYLTANQEKMMATQPDMILQFAHLIKKDFEQKGLAKPQVRAEVYVSMNGRGSRLFIDPQVNLAAQQESLLPKSWILPFQDPSRPQQAGKHH
jgi:hypothetical protein